MLAVTDMSRLPAMKLEDKGNLPNSPCVYVVMSKEQEILYVGKSVNLKNQWGSHNHLDTLSDLPGVKIAYIEMSQDKLAEVESCLVKSLKPRLNLAEPQPVIGMRQLRGKHKLRTADVASKVGIAESTVRNWEYGKTIPKLRAEQFEALLKLYEISFDELMAALKGSQAQASH